MFVIGLTGGIGSGKTEACKILDSLGAKSINADTFGHNVYKKNKCLGENSKSIWNKYLGY